MLGGRNIGIVQAVVEVLELTNLMAEAHLDELVRDFDHHGPEYRSNSIDLLMHLQRTAPFARSSKQGGFYDSPKLYDEREILGPLFAPNRVKEHAAYVRGVAGESMDKIAARGGRRRSSRGGITSQARSAAGLATSP